MRNELKQRPKCYAPPMAGVADGLPMGRSIQVDVRIYRVEPLKEKSIFPSARLQPLKTEGGKLQAVAVASTKTARAGRK